MRRKKIAGIDARALHSRECAQLLAEYLYAARALHLDGVVLGALASGDDEMQWLAAGSPRRFPEVARRGADRLLDALCGEKE